MKTVGLIAEYNPFHNGHKYHMEQARKLTNADYVVVVMSGDFTQRGYPAITDKFTRAHMALAEGADLVLELPVIYSTASAEYFALGAVSLLESLGCIDALVFGSEYGELSLLRKIAQFLISEPADYQNSLKKELSQGLSYPAARIHALSECFPECQEDFSKVLGEPNNILAIEYLKAQEKLNSNITPYTLKRVGASYHQKSLSTVYGSATGIRNAIFHKEGSLCNLQNQMPLNAHEIFFQSLQEKPPVSINDFSGYVSYALLSKNTNLTAILDIDEFLAGRILKFSGEYETISNFADVLKAKNYTHTRITRALCHLMLQITSNDMEKYQNHGISFYARALGFRKSAAPLLKAMKDNAAIPFITKLSKASSSLNETGLSMLEQDLFASKLYHSVQKKGMAYNEYTTPLIIL